MLNRVKYTKHLKTMHGNLLLLLSFLIIPFLSSGVDVTFSWYKNKVKFSHYRFGVAQTVGRGIALLFHDRGTRRGWVVSSTPRPHFTPGKDRVPIVQETGWAPGPVWTGGRYSPHRDSVPDRPASSSVAIPTELPAHIQLIYRCKNKINHLTTGMFRVIPEFIRQPLL